MTRTRKPRRVRTHYTCIEEGRLVLVPGDPTRSQVVAGWIVWHCRELVGVVVPAGLAVAVWPWAWLASGVVAAVWAVCEVRQARAQAEIKSGRDLSAAIDTTDPAASAMDTADAAEETTTSLTDVAAPAAKRVEEVWL